MDEKQITEIVAETIKRGSNPLAFMGSSQDKDSQLVMISFKENVSDYVLKMRIQNLLSNMNLKPTKEDVALFIQYLKNIIRSQI